MALRHKKKILVAMSGGVDSSVACALLKDAGHEVGGATIRTWAANDCENLNTRACCGLTGVEDARSVADALGIRYWVFNFEDLFKRYVIDYFASEYKKGRTPNPCIACNEHIKFRLFLERARILGFDAIATGHYARIGTDAAAGGGPFLFRGRDRHKDQSYVLFPLDRDVLSRLYLPCGEFTKAEIRERARALGLTVSDKPDSQEICFIPSNDYGAFLSREFAPGRAPEALRFEKKPGLIRMTDGTVLGEHEGYFHYTRGQRRGLKVAHSERLYVIETDPDANEVRVGTREEIMDRLCTVEAVNWFQPPAAETFRSVVKIRSLHAGAPATVTCSENGGVEVVFDEAQDAVTPGQAAVFYEGDRVLGGGWIASYGPGAGEVSAAVKEKVAL